MFRALCLIALGMVLGYGLSVVEVDGRPVAAQVGRIWRGPAVQVPVRMVSRLWPMISRRLGEALAPPPEPAPAEARRHPPHADADRRQLEAMVEGAGRAPRRR